MSQKLLLLCYAGCVIPDGQPTYPGIREEVFTDRYGNERRKKIESAIIACPDEMNHPEETRWNWVDLALERGMKYLERVGG